MVVPWETQKIGIVKICCKSKSFLSKHTLFASLKFVATIYIKFTELPEFCLLGRGGLLNVSLLPKSCFRHVFFGYNEQKDKKTKIQTMTKMKAMKEKLSKSTTTARTTTTTMTTTPTRAMRTTTMITSLVEAYCGFCIHLSYK